MRTNSVAGACRHDILHTVEACAFTRPFLQQLLLKLWLWMVQRRLGPLPNRAKSWMPPLCPAKPQALALECLEALSQDSRLG